MSVEYEGLKLFKKMRSKLMSDKTKKIKKPKKKRPSKGMRKHIRRLKSEARKEAAVQN